MFRLREGEVNKIRGLLGEGRRPVTGGRRGAFPDTGSLSEGAGVIVKKVAKSKNQI